MTATCPPSASPESLFAIGCGDCLRQRIIGRLATVPNALFGAREEDAVGILMYHRISTPAWGGSRPTWNVSPRRFADQMEGLLQRGFDPWPLRKVIEFRAMNRMIPRNVFVVTFDDAYANVYFSALPTLLRLHIPATVFVPTAYLDSNQPFPFDDWAESQTGKAPPEAWLPMTTRQCHELLDSGLVDLGVHTHSHQDFRGRYKEFKADLALSVSQLKDKFGITTPTFAFPFGSRCLGFVDDELIAAARDAGVACGLNSDSQIVQLESDPFTWGRLTAESFDTASTLAAKINGWHDAVRAIGRSAKHMVRSVTRSRGK